MTDNVIATATLPIFALPSGTVLFPGITVRVPLESSEATGIVSRLNKLAKFISQNTPKLKDTESLLDSDTSVDPSNPTPEQLAVETKALHSLLGLKDSLTEGTRSPLITIGVLPRADPSEPEDSKSSNAAYLTSDLTRTLSPSFPASQEALKSIVHPFGIVARVARIERSLNGRVHALLEGFNRIRVDQFTQIGTETEARVSVYSEDGTSVDNKFSIWPREELEKLETLKKVALNLIEFMSTKSGSYSANNNLAVRPELLKKIIPLIKQSRTRRAAGILTDILAFIIPIEYEDKIKLLGAVSLNERIDMVTTLIEQHIESEKISEKIDKSVEDNISKQQREFILRQKLNAIKEELGEKNSNGAGSGKGGFGNRAASPDANEDEEDIADLKKKLDTLRLPEDGQKIVSRELKRLKRMHPTQAEYQVCRTYLETIAELPWSTATSDRLDENPVARAKKILDDDHYGLNKVKKRLLEYLAVLHLKQEQKLRKTGKQQQETSTALVPYKKDQQQKQDADNFDVHEISSNDEVLSLDKSPIMLLVGPPGVGKTSLAKSVAHALGRKFHRISLGGVRDEAEIRGHRRTYVGAMPGVLVQSLRKVGVINPVILLDEIDKVSKSNFHGDPSAALLEVLDPEQNHTFTDHYINFPVDLSKTLFIATANSIDDIPGPLLDRMETINIEGYTYMDKQKIAKEYLIPKQIRNNGLAPGQLEITDEAILKIATHYTREAGVRNLEREVGTLCRGKAVEYAKTEEAGGEYISKVDVGDLIKYLGVESFEDDMVYDEVDVYTDAKTGERKRRHTYGVVNGLAYMGSGNGGLLMFEATAIPGGHGSLKTTGQLGSVIAESAELSLSWVRANAYRLGLTSSPEEDVVKDIDIHLHAPAGAVPKDGPSAGVAMTLTIISLLAKRPVPRDLALTGEMTLRGKILAVGGIREKLLGAHIAGIRRVLLPYHTRKVVEEEYTFLKDTKLEITYVKYIWDVLALVWPEERFPSVIDSHL
ncbi:uncharacterized protein SAPINGB_P000208 [Magnusiomyces paraingens]|uniref:Lon protease homolog 2, peroxisomal n=1 Tax=Magnusiomyces paraingens TaxID=2606893 RepID=A0A5E8B2R2_9ASCO|nr:uncharacterized protein SAPINGB_P000208 [Saprochaete ingens]VVT43912.1 unnamed protein product [Saprochaete ingens]